MSSSDSLRDQLVHILDKLEIIQTTGQDLKTSFEGVQLPMSRLMHLFLKSDVMIYLEDEV